MKNLYIFLFIFSILFIACDNGCEDAQACNYGVEKEDCKYAYEQEGLLIGSWNLVDIHNEQGDCLFSSSSNFDCDLDDVLQWINIGFNDDKTCVVVSGDSNLSDPVPMGNWSINICANVLNFSNNNSGYDPYLYPDYLPFGNQRIIQLTNNIFLCEDLAGNTLKWEKI